MWCRERCSGAGDHVSLPSPRVSSSSSAPACCSGWRKAAFLRWWCWRAPRPTRGGTHRSEGRNLSIVPVLACRFRSQICKQTCVSQNCHIPVGSWSWAEFWYSVYCVGKFLHNSQCVIELVWCWHDQMESPLFVVTVIKSKVCTHM